MALLKWEDCGLDMDTNVKTTIVSNMTRTTPTTTTTTRKDRLGILARHSNRTRDTRVQATTMSSTYVQKATPHRDRYTMDSGLGDDDYARANWCFHFVRVDTQRTGCG